MLRAINKLSKESIEYDQLSEMARRLPFTCPRCHEDVIPVLPHFKIRHWRHKPYNECYGEPESEGHLVGKSYIHFTAKSLGIPIELEPDKIGWHYPDLALRKTAVEFQCSPLPADEMKERETSYSSKGYRTLWIFGPKYYSRTQLEKKHQILLPEVIALANQKYLYWLDIWPDDDGGLLIPFADGSAVAIGSHVHFYRGSFRFYGWHSHSSGWHQCFDYDMKELLLRIHGGLNV